MSRAGKAMLLILLIQCGMVAAVYLPQGGAVQSVAEQTLTPFHPELIDEVRISAEPDKEIVLQRAGERWLMPGLEGLPADPIMVEKLLDSIATVDADWPVARSVAARQRFQVADYHYQRRIRLMSRDEELAALYLGTSPGFRKVHARNASADAIFSIAFNVFDAPVNRSAWIDRRLLQIRTPVRIIADAYSLHYEDGDWRSGSGSAPEERELLALLSTLRSLQVDGVAGEALPETLSRLEADLLLQVESLSGSITLELFTLDGEHFIRSSEYPFFFALSAYDFDRLTGIDLVRISPQAAQP